MSALEQPIERVNYFNGQRLVAADFRADQDYQMAVRRKLFSALYSVGIVQGLEVSKHPTDTHKVIVAPGVALDFLGREIILLDATEVQAAGTPTANPAAIFGNYLVISYAEQRVSATTDGCDAGGGACGGNLSWGAATRIRAEPRLEFTDTFPSIRSGLIVLAQVELKAGCTVGEIASGVRRYAVAAKPPTTRPIALEGEKDIDQRNPKTLYFHIDGGVPTSVTLYLRAAQLSTLYYTELGGHTHSGSLAKPTLTIPDHQHDFQSITTGTATQDPAKPVEMIAMTYDTDSDTEIRMWHSDLDDGNRRRENLTSLNPGDGPIVQFNNLTEHTHTIPAGKTDLDGGGSYPLGGVNIASSGATNLAAHTGGNALSYVNKLTVLYDGQDITAAILTQITGAYPAWTGIATLGDGTSGSPLVAKSNGTGGTGAINLDQLGLDFSPGQHSLTFQVTDTSGGQIQYNLYVG
ncbi:MAG: hypothetical protein JSR21_04410 [Proteobacteria bacterium]|nr:hypothetical protein [Pseudomonadota bacterium]